MKLTNFGRVFLSKAISTAMFLLLCGLTALVVTGCDEGMNMAGPVVMGPGEEPAETPSEDQKPSSNGEMKQLDDEQQPSDPPGPEPNPTPEPTPTPSEPAVTIESVTDEDDGSVTISGTSANVPAGETVTVTVGSVTVTTTTDASGAWTATVLPTEAIAISAGTTAVTANTATAASTTTSESSFERAATQTIHGVTISTEQERIMLEITTDVWGYDESTATEKHKRAFRRRYEVATSNYGVFDMETEIGRATFRRFVEYEYKKLQLGKRNLGIEEKIRIQDQLFGEAYGISADYARWLVHNIYLKEKPEDRHLLGRLWQTFDIAMEHLLLRIANPNATEEEILELLRESIRAGKITIAFEL